MGNIGGWELIVILVILLLIFGPSRLGDLGTALGKGIKGFKKSMKEPDEIDVTPDSEDPDKLKDTDLDKAPKNSEKKTEAK